MGKSALGFMKGLVGRLGGDGGGSVAAEAAGGAASKLAGTAEKDTAAEAESAAGKEGGFCQVHSFNPDTKVLMANGTVKPIKDINPGDQVTSTNPTTGYTTGAGTAVVRARASGVAGRS